MFKIQDLMINVLGRGGTAMPGPDDPTPPSPISPVAAVAALKHRFLEVDKIAQLSAKVDVKALDQIALEIGRAVVGVRVAAYCTQEMATCDANPAISPFASVGEGVLRGADFAVIREQIQQTTTWADERGDTLEKAAVEAKADLLPHLERAVEYLQSPRA